jgi:hypothetical protein
MRPSIAERARRPGLLRILAPATLALGYLDLVRGGLTAGPLLLVLAYGVLVPAMLLETS